MYCILAGSESLCAALLKILSSSCKFTEVRRPEFPPFQSIVCVSKAPLNALLGGSGDSVKDTSFSVSIHAAFRVSHRAITTLTLRLIRWTLRIKDNLVFYYCVTIYYQQSVLQQQACYLTVSVTQKFPRDLLSLPVKVSPSGDQGVS